jgi:hypothetical protein
MTFKTGTLLMLRLFKILFSLIPLPTSLSLLLNYFHEIPAFS